MCCAAPAAEAGAAPVLLRGCLAAQLHGKQLRVSHRVVKLYLPNAEGVPAPKTPSPVRSAVSDRKGCFVLRLAHSAHLAARAVDGRNAFIALVRGGPFTAPNVSGRSWWIVSFSRRWSEAGWRPAPVARTVLHPIVTPLGLTTAAVIRTLS